MLIRPPAGWRRHIGDQLVTYYPPDGGGHIRCHARMRPLVGMRTVVARILAGDTQFGLERVAESSRVVTREGEYAGWASLHGRCEGVAARRYVGAVFADEFVAVIDTLAVGEDRFAEYEAESRRTLESVSLELGQRVRRFVYTPPDGWQPVATGLVTTWLSPAFPADPARIVVQPARPTVVVASPEEVAQALAATGAKVRGHAAIHCGSGLSGFYYRTSGPRPSVHRDLVVFDGAPYRYELHLEASDRGLDLHRRTLTRVARSAERIPAAPAPAASSALALHWVD